MSCNAPNRVKLWHSLIQILLVFCGLRHLLSLLNLSSSLKFDNGKAIISLSVLVSCIALQLIHRWVTLRLTFQILDAHGQRVPTGGTRVSRLPPLKSVSAHLVFQRSLVDRTEAHIKSKECRFCGDKALLLFLASSLAHVHILNLLHDVVFALTTSR